jgi:hypothetical protein
MKEFLEFTVLPFAQAVDAGGYFELLLVAILFPLAVWGAVLYSGDKL